MNNLLVRADDLQKSFGPVEVLRGISFEIRAGEQVGIVRIEDALRLALTIGWDSDTLCAIGSSLTEAFYKEIPEELLTPVKESLPKDLLSPLEKIPTSNLLKPSEKKNPIH